MSPPECVTSARSRKVARHSEAIRFFASAASIEPSRCTFSASVAACSVGVVVASTFAVIGRFDST